MCVLHVDSGVPLIIGDGVSIARQSMLHGCTVKDRTLIGMNAVVLNNAVIGEDCIIGANSLIAEGKQIPPRSLVVGSPGRIVRFPSNEKITRTALISQSYIEKAQQYRASL
jgi:carbonic anhydrase/acetyltransferase-like protein (isoleucine patch superfamily)